MISNVLDELGFLELDELFDVELNVSIYKLIGTCPILILNSMIKHKDVRI